jgi:hypothetical protein
LSGRRRRAAGEILSPHSGWNCIDFGVDFSSPKAGAAMKRYGRRRRWIVSRDAREDACTAYQLNGASPGYKALGREPVQICDHSALELDFDI